ncbi:MAG TPA: hypothetical protein VFS43_39930 [Polyangiaceae bacterium]|nr:hypothetical protein [Polyangiaceae bacterium]
MGQPEQFVKQLFAEEASALTGGAVAWRGPVELGLSEVRLDGLLRLLAPARLAALPAPWSLGQSADEVVLELKLAGDHLNELAVERALLRRQAYQVVRVASGVVAAGPVPLWLMAPHLPRWLGAGREVAPGCYRLEYTPFTFLWVAANELPLRNELIPFLVARSGAALAEFVRWVAGRRPWAWVLRMVQFLPMTPALREEILRDFPETDDPEVRERQRHIVRVLLEKDPEAGRPLVEQGIERGIEQGIERGREQALAPLVRLFERRLGRALLEPERGELLARLGRLGPERLGDVVLDLAPEALAAWLADPNAR